jgi:hypothetical protein
MPKTSMIGMLRLTKKLMVDGEIGAAELIKIRH